mmetsp:Transcript_33181/g.64165  ORF Transcript_33181/g.64165 Transcript_33181/m.64165 type:complete len:219 (-) Transcript_33181:22-678(-)
MLAHPFILPPWLSGHHSIRFLGVATFPALRLLQRLARFGSFPGVCTADFLKDVVPVRRRLHPVDQDPRDVLVIGRRHRCSFLLELLALGAVVTGGENAVVEVSVGSAFLHVVEHSISFRFHAVVEGEIIRGIRVVSDGALLPTVAFALFLTMLARNFSGLHASVSVRYHGEVYNTGPVIRVPGFVQRASDKALASGSKSLRATKHIHFGGLLGIHGCA